MITSPVRAIWRLIVRIFPPREFTVMDTPRGNVYTYEQSSFWRFTKFCGKIGLFIWAAWSTYVFVYHRPLLQKRTQQLEQSRAQHARQMTELQVYLAKFNDLARNLNVTDDKILNSQKLSDTEKEKLINDRLKTWGELDFMRTRVSEIFTDDEYTPEYVKLSELSAEYELTRAENEELKKRNAAIVESMQVVVAADTEIIDTVSTLAACTVRENGQETLFYTLHFGQIEPQRLLGAAMARASESGTTVTEALQQTDYDLPEVESHVRINRAILGPGSKLAEKLSQLMASSRA